MDHAQTEHGPHRGCGARFGPYSRTAEPHARWRAVRSAADFAAHRLAHANPGAAHRRRGVLRFARSTCGEPTRARKSPRAPAKPLGVAALVAKPHPRSDSLRAAHR